MNKLHLYAPINSLGYGVVGYNLHQKLRTTIYTTLWPMYDQVNIPVKPTEDITVFIGHDIQKQNEFDHEAPTLKVWHENQLAQRIGNGPYYVYPFFEVNKFNSRRKTHLESADRVIVASQWAKNIVQDETGHSVVSVAPCGVDRAIFNSEKNKVNRDKCIFFNCGKWEVRKGHDMLGDAFEAAFPNNEPVELWMMTENPFLTDQEKAAWQFHYNWPRVKLIPRVQYQEELADIMAQTYCGVFPSRAEGWNLELLEMMSMGKHVIATNYSAHTEFCNSHNCFLIDINEEEPAYDGKWFVGDNGTWASLDNDPYEQLIFHLRYLYAQWQDAPARVNSQGIDTALEFSWDRTANNIVNIIFGE